MGVSRAVAAKVAGGGAGEEDKFSQSSRTEMKKGLSAWKILFLLRLYSTEVLELCLIPEAGGGESGH
jgi:hypothetical protein